MSWTIGNANRLHSPSLAIDILRDDQLVGPLLWDGLGTGCIDPNPPYVPCLTLPGYWSFGGTPGAYYINQNQIGRASPGSGYTYRFRLYDGTSLVAETSTGGLSFVRPSGNCTANSTTLCLAASRFKVSVAWQSTSASGNGNAISLTSDTGYFWFFSSSNVEAIIKVLDGTTTNGHFWVFAAGMTNVQATITVTDTETGTVKTYVNPQGVAFLPVQDTLAFTP